MPPTGEHPIIKGPVFLHGNSTFDVYNQFFFSKLPVALADTTVTSMAVGYEDEKALKKAIKPVSHIAT